MPSVLHLSDRFSHHVARLWRIRSRKIVAGIVAACVLFAVFLYVQLAQRVTAGSTQSWDERLLIALRRTDDPAVPIGPRWLREMSLDVTALGSPLVLTIFILASVGFLYFERQRRVAWVALATAGGGALLSLLLKLLIGRARPTVVPHLRDVADTSFPSGHTMGAAVVYLTLGVMFMKSFRSRRAKAFCLFWALFLTITVGASRVYLGVHYPSDVLGGWLAGFGWASACWSISLLIPNRPLPDLDDTPKSEQGR